MDIRDHTGVTNVFISNYQGRNWHPTHRILTKLPPLLFPKNIVSWEWAGILLIVHDFVHGHFYYPQQKDSTFETIKLLRYLLNVNRMNSLLPSLKFASFQAGINCFVKDFSFIDILTRKAYRHLGAMNIAGFLSPQHLPNSIARPYFSTIEKLFSFPN